MQRETGMTLEMADDAEQVARLWVATAAEHADQALWRRAGVGTEFFEADSCLNVVTKDRLAAVHVASNMVSMPSFRSESRNFGSASNRAWIVSLNLRVSAMVCLVIFSFRL